MSGNLREISRRRDRIGTERDPDGKAALFSGAQITADASRGADVRRPGTVVVECSACRARTRVGYLDFAIANLPLGVWLPLPGLNYNRRMTCPSCGAWTWVRASWFE